MARGDPAAVVDVGRVVAAEDEVMIKVKINKMKQASTIITVIIAIAIFVAALGIGMGIRKVRLSRSKIAPTAESKPEIKQVEPEQVVAKTEFEEEPLNPVEEENPPLEEAPELLEESQDVAQDEPEEGETQTGGGFGGFQQGGWGEYANLSEAEQARLRDAFRGLRERWMSMPEEERQAITARLRERWQNMSPEEREAERGRIRGEYEAWRRGERELSFDILE